MSGITGWVAFRRDLRGRRTIGSAMTASLASRGPDESGLWFGTHALLGHRRLTMLDGPGGSQPMVHETPNGTVCLAYSGEAYNHSELREELKLAGQRFVGRSDTEVVLRGYLQWGVKVVERLAGMYAFALWDGRIERMLLVRDRLGIKPLYFHRTPDGVVFGSEIKAVLTHPETPRTVATDGLRELFLQVKSPGAAVWDGIAELPPGSLLSVDIDGMRKHTYWELVTRPHDDDLPTTITKVRELLDDAVARQSVAEVPRGFLLSGGLDSSILTALAARHLPPGERPQTYAVTCVSQAGDVAPTTPRSGLDSPFFRAVVDAVNAQHTDIVVDVGELTDATLRERSVRALDLPYSDGDRDTSMYLLYGRVRDTSTVALSGDVADELFGGYGHFYSDTARATNMFPWLTQPTAAHATYTAELVRALDTHTYLRDSYAAAVASIERLEGESELEFRMRRINHLHITRFGATRLERCDRFSMASGLAVRMPFADHRLLEYVYNVPWRFKHFDGQAKSLLRAATADVLPETVRRRVKRNGPAVLSPRYATVLREQAAELLNQPNHSIFDLFQRDWLRQTVNSPQPLTYPDRLSVERVLAFTTWLDVYRPRLNIS